MAIDLVTVVCGTFNGTKDQVNIVSEQMPLDKRKVGFKITVDEPIAKDTNASTAWSNYIRGTLEHFHAKSVMKGFNAVILTEVHKSRTLKL